MLTAAYVMLRDGTDYHDLGADHLRRGDHVRSSPGSPGDCTIWAPRSPSAPPPEVTRRCELLGSADFDTRLWPWFAEMRALGFLRAERPGNRGDGDPP